MASSSHLDTSFRMALCRSWIKGEGMGEFNEPWSRRVCSSAGTVFYLARSSDDGFVASARERDEMDRIVACVNFLASIPTADLDTIMQNEARWCYVKRDIQEAAAFERRLQGSREGERLSEYTFEAHQQPKVSDR